MTAATVSAITAAPTAQASEINADTVVQEAPANFFRFAGVSLVEVGGWLLVTNFCGSDVVGVAASRAADDTRQKEKGPQKVVAVSWIDSYIRWGMVPSTLQRRQ